MSIHLHVRQQPQAAQSAAALAPVHPLPSAASPARPALWRRLLLTGARTSLVVAVLLFATLYAMERLASLRWKPSTMIGAFGGNQEYAHIATALEAKRAEVAMQQQEAARAQQEVIAVQAANDRATRAYEALYQRGTILAQQWAEAAKQALAANLAAKVQSLEGQMSNSATKDKFAMLCEGLAIFSPNASPYCSALRESARDDRDAVEREVSETFRRQSVVIATSLRDWAQGLPDPAELMVQQVAARDMALQAAPRPAPPPSPVYPRDLPAKAGL